MKHSRLWVTSAVVASLWISALVGPTGYTLGAFTGSASATNTQFKTANGFGTAPTVASINPLNGLTGVSTTPTVVVTFSEKMDTITTNAAFSLVQTTNGGNNQCPTTPCTISAGEAGTFTWNAPTDTQLVYTPPTSPNPSLDTSANFTVSIGTSATDATSELHVANTATSLFTTGTTSYTLTPAITLNSLGSSGVTGVKRDATITLTFNEAMEPTSTQGGFTLKNTSSSCYVYPTTSTPACSVGNGGSGGQFTWSGSGNLLTFTPPASFPATSGFTLSFPATTAHDFNAGPNYLPAYTFTFTTGSGTSTVGTITITNPNGAAWTSSSSYTIAGTVSETGDLVEVLSGVSVVASEQLTGSTTSFAILTPLASGANSFTVKAINGSASRTKTVSTISRNDPTTTFQKLASSGGPTYISVVATFSGDANSNNSATVSCRAFSGGNATSLCPNSSSYGTPQAMTRGSSQFTYTFTGLATGGQTYGYKVALTDTDGCTGCSPTASTENTYNPAGSTTAVGSITAVTVKPSTLLFASAASQQFLVTATYVCGSSSPSAAQCPVATQAELVVSNSGSSSPFFLGTCLTVGTSGTANMSWNGTGNSGDGPYAYVVELFDGTGNPCDLTVGGITTIAKSGGTVVMSNAANVSMSPGPGQVTLTTGQSVSVVATVNNYLNSPISDGLKSNSSGALVTFSASSSTNNWTLQQGGGSASTANFTSAVGDTTLGCTIAANAGQACATLKLFTAVAQAITVTATVSTQGSSSSISASTVIIDPPDPPSGLVLSPGSIRLAWSPSDTVNVAGYKIYLGHQPGVYDQVIDAGNVTSYHDTNVTYGTTYYVAVRAYSTNGLLSAPSTEGSITLPPQEPASCATATTAASPTATGASATGTAGTGSATPAAAGTSIAATAAASATGTTQASASVTPATAAPCPPVTATATASATASPSGSATPTAAASLTATATPSASCAATPSATPTPTTTPSTPTLPATATSTGTLTPSTTPSPTATPCPTPTLTATATSSSTPTPSSTAAATSAASVTSSASSTPAASSTPSASRTPTASATVSPTAIGTSSPTVTPTPGLSPTAGPTATPATPTATATAGPTPAPGTPTATSDSPTTPSSTPTRTPAPSSPTATLTSSPSATATRTRTATPVPSATSTA